METVVATRVSEADWNGRFCSNVSRVVIGCCVCKDNGQVFSLESDSFPANGTLLM